MRPVAMKSTLSIAVTAAVSALVLSCLMHSEDHRPGELFFDTDDVLRSTTKMTIENKTLPTTFLLGIFSYSAGEHRRKYIRDTYLSIDDDRICKLDEFIRQTEENPLTRRCLVAYTFVMGGGGLTRPPDHNDFEPLTRDTDRSGYADPEGDCTYLNIKENMEDGKSPTYLKFGADLARDYGIDYIGKLDDDSVLSLKLLFKLLEEDLPPAPYNTRIYAGAPRLSRIKNHVYAAGEFYFLSNDLADYIGNDLTAEDREELRISTHVEDLDMGSFVHSHPRPIKYVNLAAYQIYKHPLKTEQAFREFWETKMYELPGRGTKMTWFNYCKGVMDGSAF